MSLKNPRNALALVVKEIDEMGNCSVDTLAYAKEVLREPMVPKKDGEREWARWLAYACAFLFGAWSTLAVAVPGIGLLAGMAALAALVGFVMFALMARQGE